MSGRFLIFVLMFIILMSSVLTSTNGSEDGNDPAVMNEAIPQEVQEENEDMERTDETMTRSGHNYQAEQFFDPIMRIGYFNGIEYVVSPDKTHLAIRTTNRVLIYNIITRYVEHEIECPSPTYVKFVSNSLLKIYYSSKMYYWNLDTYEDTYTSSEPNLKGYKFSTIANYCAVQTSSTVLTVYNSSSFSQLFQITVNDTIRDFDLNPFKNEVAISNGYNVEIYDLDSNGSFVKRIVMSLYPGYAIRYFISTRELLIFSADDVNTDYVIDHTKIFRYNATTYTSIGSKSFSGQIISSPKFSNDNKFLGFIDDSRISVINLYNWTFVKRFSESITFYDFNNNTNIITMTDKILYNWKFINNVHTIDLRSPNQFDKFAVAEEIDILLATYQKDMYVYKINNNNWRYERTWTCIYNIDIIKINHNNTLFALIYREKAYEMMSFHNYSIMKRVTVSNLKDFEFCPNIPIYSVYFVTHPRIIMIYNLYTFTANQTIKISYDISSMKFSKNGNYFAYASYDGKIYINKTSNWLNIASFTHYGYSRGIIDFSEVDELKLLYFSCTYSAYGYSPRVYYAHAIYTSTNGSTWNIIKSRTDYSSWSYYRNPENYYYGVNAQFISDDEYFISQYPLGKGNEHNKYYNLMLFKNKTSSNYYDKYILKDYIDTSSDNYDQYFQTYNNGNYFLRRSEFGLDKMGIKPISRIDVSPSSSSGYYFTNFTFDSRRSTDDNDKLNELQFKWDWADGTISDWSSSYTTWHKFPRETSNKIYTVKLYTKDTDGLIGIATTKAYVNLTGTLPTAHFEVSPSSGGVYTKFTFNATKSNDNDDLSKLKVRWDWENDGVWDTIWSTEKLATHMYSTPGYKTIKMELMDTDQFIDTYYQSVTVNEPSGNPVAHFSVSPSVGYTYTVFTFNASTCLDSEDDIDKLFVRWDWESDGTWDTTASRTKVVTHQFSNPKTYAITVQVNDTSGLTDEYVDYVTVLSPTPMIRLSASPLIGYVDTAFQFTAKCFDNEDNEDQLEVRWDWESDGVWDTEYSKSKSGYHIFPSPGNYTVMAQVKDSTSLTSADSIKIVVLSMNGPPAPKNVTASLIGSELGINISWNPPLSGDVKGYHIYKSVGFTSFYMISSLTNLSYLDMDVVRGIPYYYKVAAFDSFGLEGLESHVVVCIADYDKNMNGIGDLVDISTDLMYITSEMYDLLVYLNETSFNKLSNDLKVLNETIMNKLDLINDDLLMTNLELSLINKNISELSKKMDQTRNVILDTMYQYDMDRYNQIKELFDHQVTMKQDLINIINGMSLTYQTILNKIQNDMITNHNNIVSILTSIITRIENTEFNLTANNIAISNSLEPIHSILNNINSFSIPEIIEILTLLRDDMFLTESNISQDIDLLIEQLNTSHHELINDIDNLNKVASTVDDVNRLVEDISNIEKDMETDNKDSSTRDVLIIILILIQFIIMIGIAILIIKNKNKSG